MSDLLGAQPNNDDGSASQIEQVVKGDRNQVIGQVLGGMVVYVSGGQPIINAPTAADIAKDSAKPSQLGANPYKGLLAFQETDGDRFFGRDAEIQQLWQKFCDLPTAESGVRLLPIYGPSGSGKSSLARAGLIPELARRPLPGRDKARVAVLVPGARPLEALATVLARIATNDSSPVAKTQEFYDALQRVNGKGQKEDQYDGLRRIADALPDIAISPLIVLVDQLEEIYTLCKDAAERMMFVQNLLCAASDRSNRVSVIVTMRSDFLGETQKHPALNRLFSKQGFLAPVMNKTELRRAISKPAELAGYSLDERTIDRLVYETKDREGALPLLQFALSQIWEGIEKGTSPADTLEELAGVGGALAEKAERVYTKLQPTEKTVARRIFLGLVQLGEGTRDTRRRVTVERLASKKGESAAVRQVLDRFTDPATRLITCSATEDGAETAEVTHEALFENWVRFQDWLEEGRSELRFQRRLEIAAAEWDEMGRPEGKLWRSPDLDLSRQYHRCFVDNMSSLEIDFFMTSVSVIKQAEEEKKKQQRRLVSVLSIGLILTAGAAAFATYQMQQAKRQRVEQIAITAKALMLSGQPVDGVIHAIAATGISQSFFVQVLRPTFFYSAYGSLLDSVHANPEKNQLVGHSDSVISVAYSPDSKIIATGSKDTTVRLWDATNRNSIGTPLNGHDARVNSVAFSPDGKTVVSGSEDQTVRLWNSTTLNPTGKPLVAHGGSVTSVAFSPDGKTIASGSKDKTIRLWDATTGDLIGRPLNGHSYSVTSVSFSPDGKTVVSGSEDKTIRLWDATTGDLVGRPLSSGHERAITSVAFSPDGKTIVSGSEDKTIRLWDVTTGDLVERPLNGHAKQVTSVSFSPNSKIVVSGSEDRTIRLWDATTGDLIGRPLNGHDDGVTSVSFSPDSETIVSGSWNPTVRLWSAKTDTPIGKFLNDQKTWVNSVAFSPNGKAIAIGSDNNTVRLWDATTREPISEPLNGHKAWVSSVAFSPDSKTLVSGSGDKTIRLWDVATGNPIGQPLTGHRNTVSSVAFSPNGEMILSGSGDKTIQLWDVTTGNPIGHPLTGHKNAVTSVAFSPNGEIIASGSGDNTVQLWDVVTRDPIGQPLTGHRELVTSVAFSPDGKKIISGSADTTIRIWSTATGNLLSKPLNAHTGLVFSVMFSPDGRTFVSGSSDSTVRLWNAENGLPIGQPLTGHSTLVNSVAFSPDGKAIISGSSLTGVRVWNISQSQLLKDACNQLRGVHPTFAI